MSMISIQDIRDAGYCAAGARRWFESYHLDFRAFIENGIDEKAFLATGDAMAEHVVAFKRTRENG